MMKGITKKCFISAAFTCALFGLLLGFSQTAVASGTFHATTGVHVRSEASTSSSSLTTVSGGESVAVLEHNPAGWSKVQVGSKTGYIRSDFLKVSIGDLPVTFHTTTGVHVRSGMSTSSSSLTSVPQGTSIDVFEHDPAGWSRVQVGGVAGYIRSDFLKHAPTATASSAGGPETGGPEGSLGQRKTTGNGVNMRTGPSTSSSAKVIKQLNKDTVVDVVEEVNGWSKVSHGGEEGYIRSDFLGPVSAGTQQETYTRYTIGNVNLRKSTSTDSNANIIRTLSKATAVEVTGESDGWFKVNHNGTEGYIRSDMLTQSEQGDSSVRYTDGRVNMRSGASKSSSIIRTLENGTAVTVTGTEGDWSRVVLGDTTGYIRSDLLLLSPPGSGQVVAMMKVAIPEGANVRSGPGTSYSKITSLPFGSSVDVLANESNGWSRIKTGNTVGYMKSDLLIAGVNVELVTMSEISGTLPTRKNVRVVDVRTGVSFNIVIFSKGLHADYDFPTREDVDAMFSTRGGVRSWAARPVWVYVGNRVYAAATHGMPHDANFVNNGVNGHFCLHFKDTVVNSKSYQSDLRASVQEAYNKRPR